MVDAHQQSYIWGVEVLTIEAIDQYANRHGPSAPTTILSPAQNPLEQPTNIGLHIPYAPVFIFTT